ncbi:MAG: TlyA family RNA methyltransferase [Actinobacteria bacterium]|nr:TlyA family RNA methyltransferase [Actinomycetota bacterium]
MRKGLAELLIEKKLVSSREMAIALVMEGRVKVNGNTVKKPGTLVDSESKIEVEPEFPYVSRGGIKLENAFKELNLNVQGKVAMDVGASSGGFTDFLLKNGARRVIAVDVGYGQFSWRLRNSPRVTLLERCNIRYLNAEKLPCLSDFTVVDVSFISIRKIFNKLVELTARGGEILLLIKPQFELGRKEVENKGVIKSRNLHRKVLLELVSFISRFPVQIKHISFSKIKGAKGNIEYWVYVINERSENVEDKDTGKQCGSDVIDYEKTITRVVNDSHVYFSLNSRKEKCEVDEKVSGD